eukprot:Selendium_serpulae@DN6181_c1_g2_i1.p4
MPSFIRESAEAGEALEPRDFALQDAEGESKFGFALQESLHRARSNGRLLAERDVWVCPSVSRPPRAELLTMATAAGAATVRFEAPRGARPRKANSVVFGGPGDAEKYKLKEVVAFDTFLDCAFKQSLEGWKALDC